MYFYLTTLLLAAVLAIDKKNVLKKLCINCKYYISDGISEKCTAFQKDDFTFLVRTNTKTNIDMKNYYNCKTARSIDNMCGIQGTHYVQKIE